MKIGDLFRLNFDTTRGRFVNIKNAYDNSFINEYDLQNKIAILCSSMPYFCFPDRASVISFMCCGNIYKAFIWNSDLEEVFKKI